VGQEILGAGENFITRQSDTHDRKRKLFDLVERHEKFTAYVITDSRQPIIFRSGGHEIDISGDLFFYFWKTRSDFDGIQERIQKRLALKHKVTLLPQGRIQATSQKDLDAFNFEAQSEIDSSVVESLDFLSTAISAETQTIRAINPVVYEAVRDVMRYGAFFRYCKKKNPTNFASTVRLVAGVTPMPAVRVPNCVTK
jgi:hypothetical protein